MSNHNCYDANGNYNLGSFPDDTIGLAEWSRLLANLPGLSAEMSEDPLIPLRALHQQRAVSLKLNCPRLFVSHRQCDKSEALRVAWLANQEKFDYWLDILDPQIAAANFGPPLTPYQQAILLASIIEMALLNCTHVLAVMTSNVPGTLWMPYEYGRVKDSALVSVRVAGWFDQSWTVLTTPEYFQLGQQFRTEPEIRNWLQMEWARWIPLGLAMSPCPTKPWPLPDVPQSLPTP